MISYCSSRHLRKDFYAGRHECQTRAETGGCLSNWWMRTLGFDVDTDTDEKCDPRDENDELDAREELGAQELREHNRPLPDKVTTDRLTAMGGVRVWPLSVPTREGAAANSAAKARAKADARRKNMVSEKSAQPNPNPTPKPKLKPKKKKKPKTPQSNVGSGPSSYASLASDASPGGYNNGFVSVASGASPGGAQSSYDSVGSSAQSSYASTVSDAQSSYASAGSSESPKGNKTIEPANTFYKRGNEIGLENRVSVYDNIVNLEEAEELIDDLKKLQFFPKRSSKTSGNNDTVSDEQYYGWFVDADKVKGVKGGLLDFDQTHTLFPGDPKIQRMGMVVPAEPLTPKMIDLANGVTKLMSKDPDVDSPKPFNAMLVTVRKSKWATAKHNHTYKWFDANPAVASLTLNQSSTMDFFYGKEIDPTHTINVTPRSLVTMGSQCQDGMSHSSTDSDFLGDKPRINITMYHIKKDAFTNLSKKLGDYKPEHQAFIERIKGSGKPLREIIE